MTLKNRKKASVLLQGFFIFLLFLAFYYHYQSQIWWRNKATVEFLQAKTITYQHIDVIEHLRSEAKKCKETSDLCEIMSYTTAKFHYLIEFDLETFHVIEIIITNH